MTQSMRCSSCKKQFNSEINEKHTVFIKHVLNAG